MSIITKERVAGIASGEKCYTHDDVVELARIALASLEAEPVAYVDPFAFNNFSVYRAGETDNKRMGREWIWANPGAGLIPVYTASPAPVSVPEAAPVAYIFKHPAGRLFWSLTDESNKGQRDVMPVYSAPVPAFVPPAIEPDYEVIKGILPTANPDEYACCIAADMWNACRAAMLQGAEPVTTAYKFPANTPCKEAPEHIWLQTAGVWPENGEFSELTWCSDNQHEDDTLYVRADVVGGNSPVIPDGWVMVPKEPTEHMIVEGFESEPDEFFSDEEVWEAYDAMSGCQQAAHRAKLCWAAMIAAAPQQEAKNV